jgi:hypothetical protein
VFSAITGMTVAHHHAQLFSLKLDLTKFFCLGWSGTVILAISAFSVVWDVPH